MLVRNNTVCPLCGNLALIDLGLVVDSLTSRSLISAICRRCGASGLVPLSARDTQSLLQGLVQLTLTDDDINRLHSLALSANDEVELYLQERYALCLLNLGYVPFSDDQHLLLISKILSWIFGKGDWPVTLLNHIAVNRMVGL